MTAVSLGCIFKQNSNNGILSVSPMIYIGADHAGFKAKEALKALLIDHGYELNDCGAYEYIPDDDYPDIAQNVAQEVVRTPESLGILLCGSGGGMVIAANKMTGIRAVQAWDEESARLARSHDHANILALAGAGAQDEEMNRIVEAFLTTEPSDEERHLRRIQKISLFER